MSLLERLRKDSDFCGTCPNCAENFPLPEAQLFSLLEQLPDVALTRIAELKASLKRKRQQLQLAKQRMTSRSARTAEAVSLGKICEKIAPSLPGFPFPPADCRSLLEPIDFVVFSGLSTGHVEGVTFLELKTGGARLTETQRSIAQAIDDGRVQLETIPGGGDGRVS